MKAFLRVMNSIKIWQKEIIDKGIKGKIRRNIWNGNYTTLSRKICWNS